MSRSSRRRYNLMHSNAPHRRCNKFMASYMAKRCRHREMTPDECHWYDNIQPGCPYLAFGLHCTEVQEGHWTLLHMNWLCRDMRKRNERRKG